MYAQTVVSQHWCEKMTTFKGRLFVRVPCDKVYLPEATCISMLASNQGLPRTRGNNKEK